MLRLIVTAFIATLAFTGNALAADFVVLPKADTRITFLSHTRDSKVEGRTGDVQGRIALDPAGIGDSLCVHLQFDLASLATGNGTRDLEMRNVFETKRFPDATFDGAAVVPYGTAPARLEPNTRTPLDIEGTLTLHGVSRRLALTIHLTWVPVDERSAAAAGSVIGSLGVPLGSSDEAGGALQFETTFPVTLADYGIVLPGSLVKKFAETEQVHLGGTALVKPAGAGQAGRAK